MAGTEAQLDQMQTGSSSLGDLGDQLMTTLAQLRDDAEGTASAWQGPAQVTFRAVMTRWDEDTLKLQSALTQISEMLGGDVKDYSNAEQNGQEALSHAGGALKI